MGIKSFSKVFEPDGEIKLKELKNKTAAIDAMYQLYRTAHPFKTVNTAQLTAPDGKATNHINGLIALIFKLKSNNINQIWIFDNADGHDSIKDLEVERRKACREKAKQKLQEIDEKILDIAADEILFSDDEDDADADADPDEKKYECASTTEAVSAMKNKYIRASFTLEQYMIIDLKFILDCLAIPWIEAPAGFEADQLAAYMTINNLRGIKADFVLTPDPDCLLFGAARMIKNDKATFYSYTLKNILEKYNISRSDFVKIGIILGCDFADKTPKVGPKTVLKKYKDIELSDKQKEAAQYFNKKICTNALKKINWADYNHAPFSNKDGIKNLLNWMVSVKGFNYDRTHKRFITAKLLK